MLAKLTAIDTLAFHKMQALRMASASIEKISYQISRLGDGVGYAVIGVLLAWLEAERGLAFLTTGLLLFALELPLYLLLKNTIRRERPCAQGQGCAAIKPSDKFSLPSGHAAAAFVFATLVAAYYPLFAAPAYLLAGLIGLSRVLLGVHYPADIVAGAALGIACAQLGMLWI